MSTAIGASLVAALLVWFIVALIDIDQRKQLVLGIGSGSLVAAIGLGVVLTVRGSGVVNLGSGAMAMYSAYVYNGLRTDGTLFLPPIPNPLDLVEIVAEELGAGVLDLPDFPTQLRLSGGESLSTAPSLVVTLVVAALLGALCDRLIFRPLRRAPPLAKVVASVGLLLLLQAVVVHRFGDTVQAVRPVLPQQPVTLWGVTSFSSYYLLALIVIALSAALWAIFTYTRFGLATRAAAENEKGAVLIGLSPDALGAANWVIASVLAALLGVLAAPVVGLQPSSLSLLVVPALAAALLGGFTSFGVTTAAALGIGMAQALMMYYATLDWFPKIGVAVFPGVREALVLLVIVVALYVRGHDLPTRGSLADLRMPRSPRLENVGFRAAVLTLSCAAALLSLDYKWRLAITNSLVGVAICLSLVLLTGLVGQISLAQMTFAGCAGFAVSKLALAYGVGFPWGPFAGALVAMGFGLLVAVPALRVRGVNLAVTTLAFAVFVENCVFKLSTGSGTAASVAVPPPRIFGLPVGPLDPTSYKPFGDSAPGKVPNPFFGLLCLLVVLALGLLVANVRRSATGRQFLAIRSSERAAAAAGVDVAGTKLLAFGLSSFIAGFGGALSAYRFGSVTPQYFGSIQSLLFFAFAYLGGIASITGAILGGLLVAGGVMFHVLKEWLRLPEETSFLIGAIGLILTAVLNPDGIAGALRGSRREPSARAALGNSARGRERGRR